MFAATRTSTARIASMGSRALSRRSPSTSKNGGLAVVQRRNMGGGGHWMEVSQPHKIAGEVCGFFTWLWVFYRAKHDLPVVLGLRHPWEHAEDPWAVSDHVEGVEELQKEWEEFTVKSTNPGEEDDDDEEEDEDEDEGDEGEGNDEEEDDE
mmetsp:Transcript_30453/g.63469  ORF Transcript_30453/g.63469 Transcript_30453/m.63469 type:complete len:151 (-) Transcript_30453:217-669(-)|eukprot:CAMPEP_0171359278 /NCGR_PEP_ID=MMETSP0879-20121228/514_1 /TAXON_ID=67004 /ORGANISM="Thalassiosira weissflogii, Strain CCMP1336" /LENGTH=150 /DNA_ID=CAMNT_0011865427 /DNA_START=165 /DNA_END=617 /DNA_ORIENTATION=-